MKYVLFVCTQNAGRSQNAAPDASPATENRLPRRARTIEMARRDEHACRVM
jgi:protein-tyrosine-phosphatase